MLEMKLFDINQFSNNLNNELNLPIINKNMLYTIIFVDL